MASDAGDQVESDSAQSTADQHVPKDPRPDSPEDRDSLELSEPAGTAQDGDESAESQLSEENNEYRERTAFPDGEDDTAGKSILEILDSPEVHISAPEEAPMGPISESQAFLNPQDVDTLNPEDSERGSKESPPSRQKKHGLLRTSAQVHEGEKDSYRSDSSNTGSSQYGDLGEMENTLKSLQEELQKQKFSSSHISNQAASMEQVIDTLEEDNARLLTKAEDLAAGQVKLKKQLLKAEALLKQERERSDESQLKYQELSDSIQKRKEKFVDQAAAAKSRKPPAEEIYDRHYKDRLWEATSSGMARVATQALDGLQEEERLLQSLSEEMGKLSLYLNVASADDDLCDRLAEGERPMHEAGIDSGRREAELLRRLDLYKRYIDKHKAERLPNNDAAVLNLGEQLQEALDKIDSLNERCTASEDQRDLAIAQVRDSEAKIALLKKKTRYHETRQVDAQRSSTTSSGNPADQGAQGLASHQSSQENESLDSRSSPGPDIMYENLADELEGLDAREDDRRTSILESGGFEKNASISDMLTLSSVNAEKNQLARELEQCSLNNKMLKKQLHESHGDYQALSKELKALKDQMSKRGENTGATDTETELGSSESSNSAVSRDRGPMMKKVLHLASQLRALKGNPIDTRPQESVFSVAQRKLGEFFQMSRGIEAEVFRDKPVKRKTGILDVVMDISSLEREGYAWLCKTAEVEITKLLETIGDQKTQLSASKTAGKALNKENKSLRRDVENMLKQIDPHEQIQRFEELRKQLEVVKKGLRDQGITIDPFGFDRKDNPLMVRHDELQDQMDLCSLISTAVNPARRRLRSVYEVEIARIVDLAVENSRLQQTSQARQGNAAAPSTDKEAKTLREENARLGAELKAMRYAQERRKMEARDLLNSAILDRKVLTDKITELEVLEAKDERRKDKPSGRSFLPPAGIRTQQAAGQERRSLEAMAHLLDSYHDRLTSIADLGVEQEQSLLSQVEVAIEDLGKQEILAGEAIASLEEKVFSDSKSLIQVRAGFPKGLVEWLAKLVPCVEELTRRIRALDTQQWRVSRQLDTITSIRGVAKAPNDRLLEVKRSFYILRRQIKAHFATALDVYGKLRDKEGTVADVILKETTGALGRLPEEQLKPLIDAHYTEVGAVKDLDKALNEARGTYHWKLERLRTSVARDVSDHQDKISGYERKLADMKKQQAQPGTTSKDIPAVKSRISRLREELGAKERLAEDVNVLNQHIRSEDQLLHLRDTELVSLENQRLNLIDDLVHELFEKNNHGAAQTLRRQIRYLGDRVRYLLGVADRKFDLQRLPLCERTSKDYQEIDLKSCSTPESLGIKSDAGLIEDLAKEMIRWRNERGLTLGLAYQYLRILQSQLGYYDVRVDNVEAEIETLLSERSQRAGTNDPKPTPNLRLDRSEDAGFQATPTKGPSDARKRNKAPRPIEARVSDQREEDDPRRESPECEEEEETGDQNEDEFDEEDSDGLTLPKGHDSLRSAQSVGFHKPLTKTKTISQTLPRQRDERERKGEKVDDRSKARTSRRQHNTADIKDGGKRATHEPEPFSDTPDEERQASTLRCDKCGGVMGANNQEHGSKQLGKNQSSGAPLNMRDQFDGIGAIIENSGRYFQNLKEKWEESERKKLRSLEKSIFRLEEELEEKWRLLDEGLFELGEPSVARPDRRHQQASCGEIGGCDPSKGEEKGHPQVVRDESQEKSSPPKSLDTDEGESRPPKSINKGKKASLQKPLDQGEEQDRSSNPPGRDEEERPQKPIDKGKEQDCLPKTSDRDKEERRPQEPVDKSGERSSPQRTLDGNQEKSRHPKNRGQRKEETPQEPHDKGEEQSRPSKTVGKGKEETRPQKPVNKGKEQGHLPKAPNKNEKKGPPPNSLDKDNGKGCPKNTLDKDEAKSHPLEILDDDILDLLMGCSCPCSIYGYPELEALQRRDELCTCPTTLATDSLLLQLETYHRVSLFMYACLLWLVYLPCRLRRRMKPLDFLPTGLRTILSLPSATSDTAPAQDTVPEIHWPRFGSTDYFRIFCHLLFLITLQVYIAASRERDLWLMGNSRFKSTYGIELLHGLPYPRWGPRVDPRLMASHGELWDRMTFIIGSIPELLVVYYLWLDRCLALLGGALWTVLRRAMGDGVLRQAFG